MTGSTTGSALLLAAVALPLAGRQALAPQPAIQQAPLTSARLVWSFPSTSGQPQVALGDRGTTVLRLAASATEKLTLLSSYDGDPPLPVWSIASPPAALLGIAAAGEADVYVQSDFTQTGPFSNSSSLRKYSSSSVVPDWTFDFAQQGPFLFPTFDVSRDGQTIVGLIQDELTQEYVFHVFTPASGLPVARFSLALPSWGNDGLELSSDGSTVAFSPSTVGGTAPQRTYVVDLATQSLLDSIDGELPVAYGAHAGGGLSEDGGFLVVHRLDPGVSAHVVVHERTAGGYQPILDLPTPVTVVPWSMALTQDGSRLVVGWHDWNDPPRVHVRGYDVATGTGTMSHTLGGPAGVTNVASGVVFSADGSRFAVGCWGDGSPTSPELAIFAPDQDLPLFELALGGSVFGVDLSADGQRVAVGRLPDGKHASSGYTNTVTELYDLGGQDLVLSGKPTLGATVTFELHAAPGASALLLASPALAPLPVQVPGVGRLVLERSGITVSSLGTVPPAGVLSASLTLPSSPVLVGVPIFFQALSAPQKALTADFVAVTLLP